MPDMTSSKLKIAFDASPLLINKTGVAFYTERIVRALAEAHPEIELVGFYYNFLGRRPTDHFPRLANIHFRPIKFIPSKIVYQLRRLGIELPFEWLVREPIDFILFNNFLGYPSRRKTPCAPVVHDLTYLDLPDYVAAKNRADLTRFVPEQIARSDFVITVSEFSKQKITEVYGVPMDKILVTPIPPMGPEPDVNPAERQATLQSLGITKPFLLFVGTIEPRKNIINLIEGFKQLPEHIREQYQLVIAGRFGWNCEPEMAALSAAKTTGVLHLGYVSDHDRSVLYHTASLFTSASHYEGFGMPVLEAMSYGLPCVVSDIPVFREVADSSAAYFDQNQPASIAAALTEILDNQDKRQALAIASQNRAGSFNWPSVAERLFDWISVAIGRRR